MHANITPVPRLSRFNMLIHSIDTAKTYLPDVQRAMTSAGQAAKTYLPQSVAAYLPSSSSVEADPGLAPPFSPADTDPNLERGVPTPPESPGAQLSSSSLSLSTPPVAQNSLVSAPTRTPLPALPSPAVFDDAPIAPAPTSIDDHTSAFAPAPLLPPLALPSASAARASGFALPGASSPSSAHGSTPRPGSTESKFVEGIPSPMPAPAAAADSPPLVQSERPVASPPPAPLSTPAVPGSTPINPGLGAANGAPGVVTTPRDGVAQGKVAPLPLDAPHFRAVDSGAASEIAPPVPPKTDAPDLAPPPALPTAAHDDSGADEDSGSGSDAADAAAAGKTQRKKKPKLLQRLKDKMHVGHAHA
ncbi:hypothetical protein FB451DRAFT_1173017 [Mycena latifolia]|nr:hypothetical protein FB451DRAFT_1173017 [Mycena latifolia]